MTVMAPADENECRQMLYTGVHARRARPRCAIRAARARASTVRTEMTALPVGKGEVRREGKRVAILAFGAMLDAGARGRRGARRHASSTCASSSRSTPSWCCELARDARCCSSRSRRTRSWAAPAARSAKRWPAGHREPVLHARPARPLHRPRRPGAGCLHRSAWTPRASRNRSRRPGCRWAQRSVEDWWALQTQERLRSASALDGRRRDSKLVPQGTRLNLAAMGRSRGSLFRGMAPPHGARDNAITDFGTFPVGFPHHESTGLHGQDRAPDLDGSRGRPERPRTRASSPSTRSASRPSATRCAYRSAPGERAAHHRHLQHVRRPAAPLQGHAHVALRRDPRRARARDLGRDLPADAARDGGQARGRGRPHRDVASRTSSRRRRRCRAWRA